MPTSLWKSRRALFLGAIFLSITVVPLQAQDTRWTRSRAVLPAGPSSNSEPILVIPQRVPVNVEGCRGGWCSARFEEEHGYVFEELLAGTSTSAQSSSAPQIAPERRNCCKICRKEKACGN
ncbi:MAG: SH3 domain-containing protein [Gammaproteobacteria bacterium]